jgi:hypothetical protein
MRSREQTGVAVACNRDAIPLQLFGLATVKAVFVSQAMPPAAFAVTND